MTMGDHERPAPAQDGDRLARALAALRQAPVPDGPSPEALARTLAAVEAAASSTKTPFFPRRRAMFAGLKIAAALLAAAGGVVLVTNPFPAGAAVTFAEVAGKIQKAHTLAYTQTGRVPDLPNLPPVRLLFKAPGHLRCETVPASGSVIIIDMQEARRLVLKPAAKSAVLLEGRLPGEPKPGSQDFAAASVEGIRKLAEKQGEAVGEKPIGNVRARGFKVVQAPGYETTVWADPQTRLPVQLDVSSPYGDQTIHSTISDIQIDPDLDDSLFSLEPPQGYTVQRLSLADAADKDDGSPETAIIKVLRLYAENSGGAFPKRIDDWRGYGEAVKGKTLKAVPKSLEAEAIRMAMLFARAQVFILDRKADFHYQPEGVKLGDGGKMLLWYKQKGKATYRAIFGDLHIADVPADQLPPAEKPQPRP